MTKIIIKKRNFEVERLTQYFLAKHTLFNICFIYNFNKSFVFSLKSVTEICELIIILVQYNFFFFFFFFIATSYYGLKDLKDTVFNANSNYIFK